MGCLCTKSPRNNAKNKLQADGSTEKKYSWDQKEEVNPKDYTYENLKDATVCRLSGTVNGQQFIIQNCENCNIYIFDHINTVTVDDCTNCNIFLGPTKGSVFLRDCKECRFVLACQQFRSRDCKLVDVFLCCSTQPIVESCTEIRFGCFCYYYAQLEEHFKAASLSFFNNNWYNIHDFTPVEGEQNWTLLPQDARIEDFLPIPTTEEVTVLKISTDPLHSVVPQTLSTFKNIVGQSCLVVFFNDGQSHQRASYFIHEMEQTQNTLVRTKEVKLDDSDAQRIFGTDAYNIVVKAGPVIALDYNGDDCIKCCQETAKSIATETGSTGLVYVSSTAKSASKQIENFFNYADMQMSI